MARNSITLTHVGDSMMCLKQGVLLVKGSLSMGDSTSKKERSKLQQYARTRIQQFGVHHYRTTNLVSGLNNLRIFSLKVSKEALCIRIVTPYCLLTLWAFPWTGYFFYHEWETSALRVSIKKLVVILQLSGWICRFKYAFYKK